MSDSAQREWRVLPETRLGIPAWLLSPARGIEMLDRCLGLRDVQERLLNFLRKFEFRKPFR